MPNLAHSGPTQLARRSGARRAKRLLSTSLSRKPPFRFRPHYVMAAAPNADITRRDHRVEVPYVRNSSDAGSLTALTAADRQPDRLSLRAPRRELGTRS